MTLRKANQLFGSHNRSVINKAIDRIEGVTTTEGEIDADKVTADEVDAGSIETTELKAGDVTGGDYTEIRDDGTVRGYGAATAWRDMIADLFGKRLLSSSGKVDYDYDENALVFAPGGVITTANDRAGGNLEINHEFRVGADVTYKPHIHWWQQWTSDAVLSVVFTLRYRLQRNNAAKTTSWTTITCTGGTDDVFSFTGEGDGLYNQISRFDDITITCGISDTIQFQMTRTDSESGDVSVYFVDIHGEVDSWGSEEEIVKT